MSEWLKLGEDDILYGGLGQEGRRRILLSPFINRFSMVYFYLINVRSFLDALWDLSQEVQDWWELCLDHLEVVRLDI